MKTAEQIASFVEGWKFAISTGNSEYDESNPAYNVLNEVLKYAKS